MARIFQLRIELFEPSENRPLMCFEVHEQVRRALEKRVVHFGYGDPMTEEEVTYFLDVISSLTRNILGRTVGVAGQLPF